MKLAKTVVALVAFVVAFAAQSQPSPETVRVKGRGIGETKILALKDAYRDVVERAVGLYVDSEQAIKNDALVKDRILTHSDAYVEKYDLVNTETKGGLIKVEILATVRKADLTKRLSEFMPTQTANLSKVNQSLHAQIVTEMKMNDDARTLVSAEFSKLSPLAQMMKVQLAQMKPKVEKTDNPDIVRLSYPLIVRVDHDRYYKEFVPRVTRIFDQIKVAPSKRLELRADAKLAEEYVKAVEGKFGKAAAYVSPSDEKPSEGFESPLSYVGLAQGEKYQDVFFLSGNVLGVQYILSGVSPDWSRSAFGYRTMDKYDEMYRQLRREFIISDNNRNRVDSIPENCTFAVGVIEESRAKGRAYTGHLYKIPYECVEVLCKWQCGLCYSTEQNYTYDYDPKAPTVCYWVSFKDSEGNEVASTGARLRNVDLMNVATTILVNPQEYDSQPKHGGKRLWMISPLIGGFAQSYIKWINVEVAKDDVLKIDSVSISPEE